MVQNIVKFHMHKPIDLSRRKVRIRYEPFREPLYYADVYSYGETKNAACIYYIGGAVSHKTYMTRAATEPIAIANELRKALRDYEAPEALDLIITPCPMTRENKETWLDEYLQMFSTKLIGMALERPIGRAVFIGNSMGAYYATHLAMALDEAKGLVSLAGVRMADAAEPGRQKLSGLRIKCYSNFDDPHRHYTESFVSLMDKHRVPYELSRGAGGHEFEDYAANGSVADAFRFALSALSL